MLLQLFAGTPAALAQTVITPPEGFKVLIPGEPQEARERERTTDGGTQTGYWGSIVNGVIYFVAITEYPRAEISSKSAERTLEEGRRAWANKLAGIIRRQDTTRYQGLPATNFTFSTPHGDVRARSVLAGTRMITQGVLYNPSLPSPPAMEIFFSSLVMPSATDGTTGVATGARPPGRPGCTLDEDAARRVVNEPWFSSSRPIVVMGEVFQKFGLPRRFPQDSVVAYHDYRTTTVYQVQTRPGMVFVHTGECWFQGYAVDEAGDELRSMDGAALVRCIAGGTRSLALGATATVALSPGKCGQVTANMAALTFRPASRGHFAVYVTRASGDATPTLRILDARGRELFQATSMDDEKVRGVMSVEAGTYYIVLGGLPIESSGQLRVVIHPN